MKHVALTFLTALLLAACAAPATEGTATETKSSFDRTSAEPQGADAKPGAKNTYVKGGCDKHLKSELAATSAPKEWDARILQAATANEAIGLQPLSNGTPPIVRTVAQDGPPMPVKGNYRCNMMFDINASGVPTNILSHCTDPSFTAYAISELSSVRFQPAIVNGAETVRRGVITDITVCTIR